MSRYDYRCDKCGKTKEVERPITAKEKPVICECGETMNRCWGSSFIVFKGEGWQSNEVKNK